MAKNSKISWTNHTFNPWIGCTKVSQGCKFCYAEYLSEVRFKLAKWGDQGQRMVVSAETCRQPFAWHREAIRDRRVCAVKGTEYHIPRVFCASMADVFEDWQGIMRHGKTRVALFCENEHMSGVLPELVMSTPKCPLGCGSGCRPMNMNDCRKVLFKKIIDETPHMDWLLLTKRPENIARLWHGKPNRKNVWLGTSVEDQETAEFRIPHLVASKGFGAKIFLSVEPLLAPVDLTPWLSSIDWVIVGAESGPNRRPCELDWIRSVRDQCAAANVPLYVKQVQLNGKLLTHDCQFPEDLEIRQHPTPVSREVAV